MSKAERDLYRSDALAYNIFIAEELELCSDPETGFQYFWDNYAVHSPTGGGGAEALPSFKFQSELARTITNGDHIFLKPRRMGVTLQVGCHYAVWVATIKKGGEAADIKVVSIGQTEADEVINTCKMILRALPDYLKVGYGTQAKDKDGTAGKENNSHITFPEREHASIRALTSSGARSFKATVLIIDEQAWQADADATWTASMHATEGGGQTIVISTGNGKTGRGKVFQDLYWKAKKDNFMTAHFLPWWAREDRNQEWYEDQKKKATSLEKLQQELPATEEEAFAGYSEDSAYPVSQIIKAQEIGEKYDGLTGTDQQLIPESGIIAGIDWGKNSAAAIIVPLAGFGFWQVDEITSRKSDAETFARNVIEKAQYWANVFGTTFETVAYDAAGSQQMESFARIAQDIDVNIVAIPFGKYKLKTIQFTKLLLRRSNENDQSCYLAISPRCQVTAEQMTNIKHKDNGDFKKGDDHNIDALIAGLAISGVEWDNYSKS
jgi:hypothetical protein